MPKNNNVSLLVMICHSLLPSSEQGPGDEQLLPHDEQARRRRRRCRCGLSGPQYSNIVMDQCQTMDHIKETKVKVDSSATPQNNCDLDYLNSSSAAGAEESSTDIK
jgi:hypothetical protein